MNEGRSQRTHAAFAPCAHGNCSMRARKKSRASMPQTGIRAPPCTLATDGIGMPGKAFAGNVPSPPLGEGVAGKNKKSPLPADLYSLLDGAACRGRPPGMSGTTVGRAGFQGFKASSMAFLIKASMTT